MYVVAAGLVMGNVALLAEPEASRLRREWLFLGFAATFAALVAYAEARTGAANRMVAVISLSEAKDRLARLANPRPGYGADSSTAAACTPAEAAA
jgi:hypothetical protein